MLAAGMAKGARKRGKRIAFGDGKVISWDKHSEVIFRGNPNIAKPGSEGAADLEWIDFRKGNRQYNTHDPSGGRWIWNRDFQASPGEIYFDEDEIRWVETHGSGYVVIEPNVEAWKSSATNKQWPVDRYDDVARRLKKVGLDVVQFGYSKGHRLAYSRIVHTPTFRHALAALSRAGLYIGPEGGLHHGAAAVGIPAVVLFGGFVPPEVTGYETHTNLIGGAEPCGSLRPCDHCKAAMDAISVTEVVEAALAYFKDRKL